MPGPGSIAGFLLRNFSFGSPTGLDLTQTTNNQRWKRVGGTASTPAAHSPVVNSVEGGTKMNRLLLSASPCRLQHQRTP
jgi:hypothetical protein